MPEYNYLAVENTNNIKAHSSSILGTHQHLETKDFVSQAAWRRGKNLTYPEEICTVHKVSPTRHSNITEDSYGLQLLKHCP